jgi:hypothetical protein
MYFLPRSISDLQGVNFIELGSQFIFGEIALNSRRDESKDQGAASEYKTPMSPA